MVPRTAAGAQPRRGVGAWVTACASFYIIGLDFHVGFLVQTERDLRFVHASYVTETVLDEPAATAVPIVTSKYRVVGKILSADNLDDWLRRRRIEVRGNW